MEKLKKIVTWIYNFVTNLTGDNVSVYAAQASFFLIISAIPLATLFFAVIKLFINVDLQTLIRTINAFAPEQISGFITEVLDELFSKSSSIPVISITAVSTLWLASRGIMALYMGLNNVYHIPRRNYIYSRLMSIFYTLALLATLVVTLLVFTFGNKLEMFISQHWSILSDIIQLILRGKIIFFLAYLTLLFAMFYKFMPKRADSFRRQLPGAFCAAAGWIAFSFLYSIYINNFSNYSYVYGSVAAVVLLMLWLYICMNILLYGAQLNKMIENGFFKK